MVQFVHQLMCLSCLLEIVYLILAELTHAVVEGFEATSVSPADQSGLWKEQYSLRDFVSGSHFSGGLNEEFKKASVSLLLGRFITQTADSLHGIFFYTCSLKIWLLTCIYLDSCFNLDTHAFDSSTNNYMISQKCNSEMQPR